MTIVERRNHLNNLLENGKIGRFTENVRFQLIPDQTDADNKRLEPFHFVVDFMYKEDGKEICEKVIDGMSDYEIAEVDIARKLMLKQWGFTVRLVEGDE